MMRCSPLTLGWNDALQARIDPFGATLTSLRAPGPGGYIDLILPAISAGRFDPDYVGRLIGRYANRLANAKFAIAGRTYAVGANDGSHHMHGGPTGLHSRQWAVMDVQRCGAQRLVLNCNSPDGDGGYPGALAVTATYELTPDTLRLSVAATSDRHTPVSFTLHPYFNLTGSPASAIDDHELAIDADRILPIDALGIPDGPASLVDGTPFDFRRPTRIADRLGSADPEVRRARGFDHAYVLNGGRPAARLFSPSSRMVMQLFTNQPALHFYTGQALRPPWRAYQGLCLEPEQFPNAPNRPDFPCATLVAGETFHFECAYSFSSS